MLLQPVSHKFVVAVTGAQGVGKSTFCQSLWESIVADGRYDPLLLDGLGKFISDQGIPYGSSATPESIAAIYAGHIERETQNDNDYIIQDRCCIDALAYIKCLNITGPALDNLYIKISKMMAARISLVVHLEMSGIFCRRQATHESEELRTCVASLIPGILKEFNINYITINASDLSAVSKVKHAIDSVIKI